MVIMASKRLSPNTYFYICAPLVGIIAILALLFPKGFARSFTKACAYFYTTLDWCIILSPLIVLILCLYLAFSSFGKRQVSLRVSPEYSTFAWLSMLFAAGMGVGIIYYGPVEALWHLKYSPYCEDARTISQKARLAMSTSVWFWGISAWGFYTISGVICAYFVYTKRTSFSVAAPIYHAFKRKFWAIPLARLAMIFTIFTVAISLAATLAMAAGQLNAGFKTIFHSFNYSPQILFIIFILSALISLSPIKKGMKHLSFFTITLALFLLVFIFILGPSRYFLMTFVESFADSLKGSFTQPFELFIFHKDRYFFNWFVISYFLWWIGWSPFMGIFIAKISKGRSFRQMILCSIFVPGGFIMAWFSIFSGYALLEKFQGKGLIAKAASSNYESSIYVLLDLFPLSFITKPLLIICLTGFVLTTIVSGCISLGILTGKDGLHAQKPKVFVWIAFMSLIALPFTLGGKVEGIKAVGSLACLPYFFCYFLTIAAFLKTLRLEKDKLVS